MAIPQHFRPLLAAALIAAALGAGPARADLPVIDATSIGKMLEQIGISGEQLTQLKTTATEVLDVYHETQAVYNSVAQSVGADTWAAGLLGGAARNPLPFTAAAHPGWVGGLYDPAGLPFGSQYLAQNTVGGSTAPYEYGDFVGTELLKAVRSVSTMQALASNNVRSIENRILALGDLFNHLATIGTLQQTDSLKARLEAEANYAHSQNIQSQNLRAAAEQQLAVLKYNQLQYQYQDEGFGIGAQCRSMAASPVPYVIPACNAVLGRGTTAANSNSGG